MGYFLPGTNAKVAGSGRRVTKKHIFPSLQNGNILSEIESLEPGGNAV